MKSIDEYVRDAAAFYRTSPIRATHILIGKSIAGPGKEKTYYLDKENFKVVSWHYADGDVWRDVEDSELEVVVRASSFGIYKTIQPLKLKYWIELLIQRMEKDGK